MILRSTLHVAVCFTLLAVSNCFPSPNSEWNVTVPPGMIVSNLTNNTNLDAPAPGTFEQKIREGIDFLRSNGMTTRARTRFIKGHPNVRKARQASDFIHFEISMVDEERHRKFSTKNYPYTAGHWIIPPEPLTAPASWEAWDLQGDYISLEEAVRVVTGAGWVGPWELLSIYHPELDPLSKEPATEPFYGFHTHRGEGYAVVGMRSRRCFFFGPHLDPGGMPYPSEPDSDSDSDVEEVTR